MEIVNTKIEQGLFAILAGLVVLGGCGSAGDDQPSQPVYDKSVTIPAATTDKDTGATISQYISYDLGAGTYSAEITSSSGISVQWIPNSGTGCAEQTNIEAYAGTCTLPIKGQLVLVNPRLLTTPTVTLKVIQH